jgi:hypothetical protein
MGEKQPSYTCYTCVVHCTCAGDLMSHIRGKQHKKKMKTKWAVVDEARQSVWEEESSESRSKNSEDENNKMSNVCSSSSQLHCTRCTAMCSSPLFLPFCQTCCNAFKR